MLKTLAVAIMLAPIALAQSNLVSQTWVEQQGYSTGGGIPSGLIVLSLSSCPTGFSEVTALNGKFLQGTLAANGDVGTTGGNTTVTPSGTVSQPTLAMNSYTPAGSVSAPTFTGTQGTTSATSGGTPAGTLTWPASVPTFSGSALAAHAHELPFQIPSTMTTRQIAVATFGTGTSRAATAVSATGTANTTSAAVALSQSVSAGTPAGTIAWPASVPTFSGSALAAHTHTMTPSGNNSAPSFTGQAATLTGSVSQPTFSGASLDPRPPFVRVIFCSKN